MGTVMTAKLDNVYYKQHSNRTVTWSTLSGRSLVVLSITQNFTEGQISSNLMSYSNQIPGAYS